MSRWIEDVRAVVDERENQYTHPLINFLQIAEAWNGVGQDLVDGWVKFFTVVHVSRLMNVMKESRDIPNFKPDDHIDIIGYTDCINRIDAAMKDIGYPEGVSWFWTCTRAQQIELLSKILQDPVLQDRINRSKP